MPGTLKESYELRNKAAADLKAIREAVKNGETIDEAKSQEIDRLLDEHGELVKHIDLLEKLEKSNFEQVAQQEEKKPEKKTERTADQAFGDFLRYGNIREEDRSIMVGLQERGAAIMGQSRAATDPQSHTAGAGGYLIPEGFQASIDVALLNYFQQLEAYDTLNTGSGNDIPWPSVNDTSNKGRLLDENAEVLVKNAAFLSRTLKAYMFTSDMVKIPIQLLQDSAIPLESLISNLLAERLGRTLSDYTTTGAGTTEPEGVVTGATASGQSSVAATAITRDNILDLIYSVDGAYRSRASAALMMHDSTFKAIAKLTIGTSDDRPLWQPSIIAGQPDTIEGKRIYINNSMAEIGAGNVSVLFGDFKKFLVRRVMGTTLFVFREKYMDFLQIAIMAYSRWDSKLIDAGTHPIKKMTHSAT